MAHDAGHRVFVVRVDWTAVHTCRIHAVMARRGDRLLHRLKDRSAKQHADIAPSLVVVEPVQIMARGHARLATCAGVQIDGKRILFPRRWRRKWNQVAVILRLRRHRVPLVLPGEYGDGRQKLLLVQQIVDQRATFADQRASQQISRHRVGSVCRI